MAEIQDINLGASYLNKLFERKTRDNGDEFTCLVDGAPDWMLDLVREAHDNMGPNDYSYTFIEDAVCKLADCNDPDEICIEPDPYTHNLTHWLHSDISRVFFLDEVLQEQDIKEGFQLLAAAQWKERDQILSSVRSSIESLHDESISEAEDIGNDKESCEQADMSIDTSNNGKILGVTQLHVVQNLGRKAVIYHKANLDRIPEVGEEVTVNVKGGSAIVEPKAQDLGKSLDR